MLMVDRHRQPVLDSKSDASKGAAACSMRGCGGRAATVAPKEKLLSATEKPARLNRKRRPYCRLKRRLLSISIVGIGRLSSQPSLLGAVVRSTLA